MMERQEFHRVAVQPFHAGAPGMTPALVLEKVDQEKVFITKTEVEPQLGGEGSGFPPRFHIATGSLGHAIIGIDIGSHWTRVASVIRNQPTLLTAPVSSMVVIGDNSQSNSMSDPELEPSYSLLNLIGTDYDLRTPNDRPSQYSVEELLQVFMHSLIEHSQKSAEHLIKKCVLTVPASFSCERRRLLREVVENSGLEVLNLINESTAAALAYVHNNPYIEGNVLIFGMGANHFATSLIEVRNGILETRSTSADAGLGGEEFDNVLIQWLFQEFQNKYNKALPKVPANLYKLRLAAERAKLDLTMSDVTYLRLTGLIANLDVLDFDDYTLFLELRREHFLKLSQPLIDKAIGHVCSVLMESRLNTTDVDYVIPVGSASQMPTMLNALKAVFPRQPSWIYSNLPDASAKGAALHASILTRTLRDMVVWDALAVPICVELSNSECKVVISKGTPLPITGYYQIESADATVNLHIMQGYSERAEENCSIAEVAVNNCPPTSSANTKVEIAIMIRADGTADFSARHVELQVNLPVTVRRGLATPYAERAYKIAPENAPKRARDPERLARLCRKLNMPEAEAIATLKTLRYSQAEIENGTAIETLIRSLTRRRRKQKPAD